MKFKFSLKVTVICSVLALLMIYASYWQYTRYVSKLNYIEQMDTRLKMPVQPLNMLINGNADSASLIYRRVSLKGIWDYEHEVILRNRKLDDVAGVHVVTPFLVDGLSDQRILISRGFIPLSVSSKEDRIKFQNGPTETFLALVKETSVRKIFAPEDPYSGLDKPWVDAWLRIDIASISKQLPYPILPFYLEMMSRDVNEIDSNKFLEQKSGRDEIFFLPGSGAKLNSVNNDLKEGSYPVPVFDSVVPAGRHFSYIFEWAIMAAMVIIAAVILQLKRS